MKNINSMSKEDLMNAVKNIGEKRAQEILDYCKKRGGVSNLDELKNAPGIDEVLINDIKSAGIDVEKTNGRGDRGKGENKK